MRMVNFVAITLLVISAISFLVTIVAAAMFLHRLVFYPQCFECFEIKHTMYKSGFMGFAFLRLARWLSGDD